MEDQAEHSTHEVPFVNEVDTVSWANHVEEEERKTESNVQTLLKKHKVVANELKNYQSTIDALYDQASALGEEDRESGSVVERLSSTDRSRNGLCGVAKIRKQRLLDALSLCKLFTEADDVEQ